MPGGDQPARLCRAAVTPARENRHLEEVRRQFETGAKYWTDVYEDESLHGQIYAERRDATLAKIDALGLPPDSPVLEIGSGGGLMAVELAQRGFQVMATDLAPRLTEATLERASSAGFAQRIHVQVADAAALPFPRAKFHLVVAIAVIQWMECPDTGLAEIARVLAPGGYLAATFANSARLDRLFDPRTNPYLGSTRRRIADLLERLGISVARDESLMRFHGPFAVGRMLDVAGLQRLEHCTIGFGPFTILGASRSLGGRRTHACLQRFANRRVPIITSTGSNIVVIARKR